MGVQERRERERQARRKAVLDATRRLVRERGFGGTTTRQIAEACELSEATLFWHFQSKNEIFSSLLFEGIDFMARGLEEIAAADLPACEKLARLWRFFAEVHAEHPEHFHVFSYLAHPQSTASVSEDVRAELARRSGDNFRRFAELLAETTGCPDPRLAADLMWAASLGLMILRDSRVNLGAKPHPEGGELEASLRLLCAGIAPGLARGRRARRRR